MSINLTSKNITAIVIGNALEWYDFVVYSFLTVFIAKLFFPATSPTASLLAATATFGVAFLIRPLGGVVFGMYADKYGRKSAITAVIASMTMAILIISFAPTYAQVGILAPLIILFARLIQGFSAGGEFSTSMAMLIELSPYESRGFYGSWQMVGQVLAMLAGSSMGMLLTSMFSETQIENGAWRIPFFVGLIIAPVGFYIRQHMTEDRKPFAASEKTSLMNKLSGQWQQVLIAMGLVVGGTVSVYINISYIPTFASIYLHLSLYNAFFCVTCGALLMVILMPFVGKLSDRIGRKPILLVSLSLYLLLVYPLFVWLIAEPTVFRLMIVELISCILLAGYYGVYAVIIAEIFPRDIRSTGLGISYNMTVMLFGGFAQFIVTWLVFYFKSPIAITYYLYGAIILTLIAAFFYDKKRKLI